MSNQEFKDWQARLDVAHRKHDSIKDDIDLWRDYYRGKQWDDISGAGYKDQIVENMVFSNIRTIMPSINLNNPKIYCNPVKKPYIDQQGMIFDTIGGAAVWEVVMNHYYRCLKVKNSIDAAINDALIGPWGIVQLGYTLETEKVKGDKELEVNELIKSESVFVVRRSPHDLRFDTNATDSHLYDARWIALRWVKPLEDVKANPKYSNTRYLRANVTAKTDNFGKKNNNGYKPLGAGEEGSPDIWAMVEGWDIWDKKTRKLMTLVPGHDKFIYKGDWPIDIDGFPIEILYYNENPDEVYPISDVEIYRSAQDELNRIHSLQLSHIRRISERKYGVRENTVDPDELELLKHGGDGTVVTTRSDPNTAIVPIKDASISQDMYALQNILKNSIREAAGVAAFEKGISQKYDTAAEPTLISQGSNALRAASLKTTEDFIKRIVQKMADIIAQTMDEHSIPLDEEQFSNMQQYGSNYLARIVGQDGKQTIYPWLEVNQDALKGKFDFGIEIGSTQPVNDDTRKQDAITLYNMMGTNPYLKQREGTKYVMEAFKVTDPDKFLKSDEQVGQEQQQSMMSSVQAQKEVDAPKRETDLAKTIIKSGVQILTSSDKTDTERQKVAAEAQAAAEKVGADRHKTNINMLQSALRPKTRGKE